MNEDKEAEDLVHRSQKRYQMPKGGRQILLVRHGASVGATVNTLEFGELTLTNPALSPEGEAQAQALARHLSTETNISAIFVTPLQRTQQTAAPLAAVLGLEPIVVPELREVHMGDWEHSFYEYAAKNHPLIKEMFVQETWEVLPNSEPMVDFSARIRAGILAIAEVTPPDSTVVSVSHAGSIAEICRQATGSRPFAFAGPENTSVSRLIVAPDGSWKLRSYNDVTHLGY